MGEPLTVTVPAGLDGARLDRVVAVMGEMSRAAARRLVEAGEVTVDGTVVAEARLRLATGQRLMIPPTAPAPELIPEPVPFDIVHGDEHLIVIDKPPGLVVHPGAGQSEGTLAAGILHRFPQVAGVGQEGRWGIVHRLDRDTSGLMVVALTTAAYEGLSAQVSDREMERHYLALVDGTFGVPTGTVDAPIARDPTRPTRQRVDPAGRPAITHYVVERSYPESDVSLLRVRLDTGRTHQIRVHMAAIDHPLAGDRVYRPGPDRVPSPRLFLHATRLTFAHPLTGEPLAVDAPLPTDLEDVLATLSA